MSAKRSSSPATSTTVAIEGHQLKLTNLEKVLYPSASFTKRDVISYYVDIAPVLLPHVKDRPLTLRRFPDGVDAPSFYAKHVPPGAPPWVRRVSVPSTARRGNQATIEFVVVDDLASLVWVANLASLELHVPMWRVTKAGKPEPPDLMVFDLDPGEPATIVDCARIAQLLREEVKQTYSREPVPKTSGSKGMQLYLLLEPHERAKAWDEGRSREEAHNIAQRVATRLPELVTANMRKDLRQGKVLIDWSQNNVAKTTVAPYSLRARPEPTISTPLTWSEVARCAKGNAGTMSFLPDQVRKRVRQHGDLFDATLVPASTKRAK